MALNIQQDAFKTASNGLNQGYEDFRAAAAKVEGAMSHAQLIGGGASGYQGAQAAQFQILHQEAQRISAQISQAAQQLQTLHDQAHGSYVEGDTTASQNIGQVASAAGGFSGGNILGNL